MAASKGSSNRIFPGLLLIAVGVLFLLDRMGRLDFGAIAARYWPVIFILIGVSVIIGNHFKDSGAGVFFILFGTFFLLMKLEIFNHRTWHYFWPILIIAVGFWILIKPAHGGK